MEEGGYVAFEDVDVPGWELIGPQKANPAPFYLIWKKAEQSNLESHPRPWQLVTIEMARFEDVFPKTAPKDAPEPAQRGYALFRDHCVKCHAINREGGHVGPDLNVPQNILEYRPEAQVRAYIKNPQTFRYGNMPAHTDMTDADLDALIAYLRAMKDRKQDQ
jgi:mono/diheme cytochrome c family protein